MTSAGSTFSHVEVGGNNIIVWKLVVTIFSDQSVMLQSLVTPTRCPLFPWGGSTSGCVPFLAGTGTKNNRSTLNLCFTMPVIFYTYFVPSKLKNYLTYATIDSSTCSTVGWSMRFVGHLTNTFIMVWHLRIQWHGNG